MEVFLGNATFLLQEGSQQHPINFAVFKHQGVGEWPLRWVRQSLDDSRGIVEWFHILN